MIPELDDDELADDDDELDELADDDDDEVDDDDTNGGSELALPQATNASATDGTEASTSVRKIGILPVSKNVQAAQLHGSERAGDAPKNHQCSAW